MYFSEYMVQMYIFALISFEHLFHVVCTKSSAKTAAIKLALTCLWCMCSKETYDLGVQNMLEYHSLFEMDIYT
jgi:hypothetical protein